MPPRLGLIRKIEDLGLTGVDRKKAESAAIGVKRERASEDDGSSKTSTTLTFGTLGLRATGDDAVTPAFAFAFANCSLSRNRTKPAAALLLAACATALGPTEPLRPEDSDATSGAA